MPSIETRPLARSLNSATVLRTIVGGGLLSRAEIARQTGLSAVTVGAIVSELMDQALVVESGETDSTAGRPGRLLALNASSYGAIGVKLTDTRLVGAVTDLRATVVAEAHLPLTNPSPADFIHALTDLVGGLLSDAGLGAGRLLGVGIGLPGVVDSVAGTTHHSPFLRWTDEPVRALAEEALGVPVFVENDVNTLALTERWFGVGQGVEDFLLVTLGQGIGLGIVLGGHLHRGARGGVGEFGHTVVDGSTDICECGNVGCLEAVASEGALMRRSGELAAASGTVPVADLRELHQRAMSELDLAALVIDAGTAIGRGVANLVNVLAPELVIVSGEGIVEGSVMVNAIQDAVADRTFPGLVGRYELLVEQLPDGPWARGAASLVLAELFMSPATFGAAMGPASP